MSRQPDRTLVGSENRDAERPALLGDYLDHLCAPLVGLVPYAERQSLRLEVESHLAALAEEYEFQGRTPPAAMKSALAEFGEPWQVGQSFLREWLQGSPQVAPAYLTRQAACRAFGFFGAAALPIWALLECHGFDSVSLLDLPPWLRLVAALPPVMAGILTGRAAQPRMGRGIIWALGILIIHAVVTAALMLPQTSGFGFALYLALWALPGGWLSATVTARLVRNHHRQRFLKRVG